MEEIGPNCEETVSDRCLEQLASGPRVSWMSDASLLLGARLVAMEDWSAETDPEKPVLEVCVLRVPWTSLGMHPRGRV